MNSSLMGNHFLMKIEEHDDDEWLMFPNTIDPKS